MQRNDDDFSSMTKSLNLSQLNEEKVGVYSLSTSQLKKRWIFK